MVYSQNILGGGYIALVSFLWIVAGMDYNFNNRGTLVRLGNKQILLTIGLLRLAFGVLWFMAAFRGLDVTNDTNAYFRTYQRIAALGFAGESRMEVGFVALNVLLSKLFPDVNVGFHILLFVSSVLSYSGLERWIERHAESYGVCILAFYFLINASYMSAMRESIAVGIVLWALTALEERKYIRYVFTVLVASTFHISAIVAFLFILFMHRKYTKAASYTIVILAVVATMTNAVGRGIYFIWPSTAYVVGEVGNLTNVVVMSSLYLSLLVVQIFASDSFYQKEEDDEVVIGNDFFIYCIATVFGVTVMSLRSPVLSRVTTYFLLTGLPFISNVMASIKRQEVSLLIKVVFCLAIWVWSVAVLKLRPEWQHIWPYHFWWS